MNLLLAKVAISVLMALIVTMEHVSMSKVFVIELLVIKNSMKLMEAGVFKNLKIAASEPNVIQVNNALLIRGENLYAIMQRFLTLIAINLTLSSPTLIQAKLCLPNRLL